MENLLREIESEIEKETDNKKINDLVFLGGELQNLINSKDNKKPTRDVLLSIRGRLADIKRKQ